MEVAYRVIIPLETSYFLWLGSFCLRIRYLTWFHDSLYVLSCISSILLGISVPAIDRSAGPRTHLVKAIGIQEQVDGDQL